MLLIFLQFLGILAAVVLLQVAAGVLAYLFADLVTPARLPRRPNDSLSRKRCNDDVLQVTERTEKLMMKTVVGYREDRDLENAIDFIQKKVGQAGGRAPGRE